ncbi:MAG: radical SAM protein [Planctomycetota bacterium]
MVPSDLAKRIERVEALYESCQLCERRCEVNRLEGERGYCGLGKDAHVFNELLHFGEELELIPSHAVYVTGCNFRCVFCMTGKYILKPNVETHGTRLDPKAFAEVVRERVREGATNLNFLGGEPSVNTLAILKLLEQGPKDLPVVWNTNMYMTTEQLEVLDGVVDVYLADWKYGSDACALKLSNAPDYMRILRRNMGIANKQTRVVVRYLVMPGHNDCCFRPIAQALANDFPGVPLSILDPYIPLFRAHKVKGMDRASTSEEAEQVREIARELNIEMVR